MPSVSKNSTIEQSKSNYLPHPDRNPSIFGSRDQVFDYNYSNRKSGGGTQAGGLSNRPSRVSFEQSHLNLMMSQHVGLNSNPNIYQNTGTPGQDSFAGLSFTP